jgi:hypothetical protein
MAQTNFTPIYLYNSGTANNMPLAANLGAGELAINYEDGKLFYKDNSSAIQVIGWKTTPTTAGGTGLTSYTAGDLPYYASGSALSKLGIGTANYVLTSSGSAPQYVAQSTLSVGSATNATNTAITNNTSSSATWYPTIVSATIGNLPQTTSSTKLSFQPSTGNLTVVGSVSAQNLQGPSFSSYTASGTQTLSASTDTKIIQSSTQYDTASCFNTSTYRFTPTVAGYYLFTGQIDVVASANSYVILAVWKNGAVAKRGNYLNMLIGTEWMPVVSAVIYMNGSTDYVELYASVGASSLTAYFGQTYYSYFQGTLLRSA